MKRKKTSDGDPDKKRGAVQALGDLVAPGRQHSRTQRRGLAAVCCRQKGP